MENNQEDSQEVQNQHPSHHYRQLENLLLDIEQAELGQNTHEGQQNEEVFIVPFPVPELPQPIGPSRIQPEQYHQSQPNNLMELATAATLERPILLDPTPMGQTTTTTTTTQPNLVVVNTNQEQDTITDVPATSMEDIAQLLTEQQNSGPTTMTLSMVRKRKMMDPAHNLSDQTKSRRWQETLRCVICSELPRLGPLYTCSNGHLICQNCRTKVLICPSCRDPVMTNRSIITEAVIETYLKDNYESCLYDKGGCKVKTTLEELQHHEPLCPFMEVSCPGRLQGCTWRGPRSRMFTHISGRTGQTACVDVVRSVDSKRFPAQQHIFERYTCLIRDFKETEVTCFLKQIDINWRPILHIPYVANKIWTYLVVSRCSTGIWKLSVKGYMPQQQCDEVKACITISSANSEAPNNGNLHNLISATFAGGITSHWASDRDAWDMGRCLLVSDNTIAQLRHPTEVTKLFNYTVTIKYKELTASEQLSEREGLAPARPRRPTAGWQEVPNAP
jgi:hypothetical protein